MPELSIVIPTKDRPAILEATLAALARELDSDLPVEVIVIDDGSRLSPEAALRSWEDRLPLRWRRQDPRGPAAARNHGVSIARGWVVLFLGDDIIAQPGLVRHHLEFHRRHPEPEVAMLGRVTWDPAIGPTPFLRWLETEGLQFGYGNLTAGQLTDFRYFYTSNISLKRAFLEGVGGFDERFPSALYEDTELGYRLQQRGLKLIYRPEALGYHRHPTRFSTAAARERRKREALPLLLATPVGSVLFPEGVPRRDEHRWAARLGCGLARTVFFPLRILADTRVPLPTFVYAKLLEVYAS